MNHRKEDIVIIGAGASGLTAALRLKEKGIQACVFERSEDIGGSAHGGGGIFAVESHKANEHNYVFTRQQAFEYYMQHTNGDVDAGLVSEFINRSSELVDWLESLGARFHSLAAYFRGAPMCWHTVQRGDPQLTDVIWERYKALGGTIHTGYIAKRLLKDGDTVCGVVVEDASGAETAVSAKCVLLATGGYIQNADIINQYSGYTLGKELPETLPFMHGETRANGSGLEMAWEAGAEHGPMCISTSFGLPDPYAGPGGVEIFLGDFRQPNLMVNLNGERIGNEENFQNPGIMANLVRRQREYCAIMIFDQRICDYYEAHGWDHILVDMERIPGTEAAVKRVIEEGYPYLYMADSLAELCQKTGIEQEPLERTLREYNNMCDMGVDTLFYKDHKYLRKIEGPRYYAARMQLNGMMALGGLNINRRCEVIAADRRVIPGLYAAGMDANTINGIYYSYATCGSTSGFAFISGMMAADALADRIHKMKG